MPDLSPAYTRFVPTFCDEDGLRRAVWSILDHIDERADSIAREVIVSARSEVPEYAALSSHGREQQEQRHLMGIAMISAMVRAGVASFDQEQRRALVVAGEVLAGESQPLHAVIRTYQLAARVLINEALAATKGLGDLTGAALVVVFRMGFGLLSQLVEAISEGYVETIRERRGDAADIESSLVSDLVLGISEGTFATRARLAGLRDGDWYRVVLIGMSPNSQPSQLDPDAATRLELPVGTLFGKLAHVGVVVIAGRDDDDPTERIVHLLERRAREHNAVIVSGPKEPTLADVRTSFESAVTKLGTRYQSDQRSTPGDQAVAKLLSAARGHGIDVSGVLARLQHEVPDEADELLATIHTYVRHGCSVQASAEALHMHRNTVRRRIRRAEQVLGFKIAERWDEVELAVSAWSLSAPRDGSHLQR